MAVYNEIGIARWNRFIQKLTDMKASAPARQLASEIAFNHPIQSGAENRYIESWHRFGFKTVAGPTAAVFSAMRLRNPAGSNVVAVIEKMVITFGGAAAQLFNVEGGLTAIDLNLTGTGFALDPRGQQASTCILSTNNAGFVALNTIGGGQVPGTSYYDYIQDSIHELPVLPGFAVGVNMNPAVVNVQQIVGLIWRERFLEPAERF